MATLRAHRAAGRRAFFALVPILVAAALLCGACAPRQAAEVGDLEVSCPLARFVELGVHVAGGLVRFEPADEGDPTEIDLTIDGSTATGAVALTPGTWYLTAELYGADEALVATGEATAVVLPGAVTQVRLRASLVNGGVDVRIEWDESPSLYIADISDRPVEVEIQSMGSYLVSGLSRVGWDVQVIETPTTGGRTHKQAGVVTYPDIAMLGLSSGSEEVASLAAWAEDPVPRDMVLSLRGLDGEVFRYLLYQAVPVAANTRISEAQVAGDFQMGGIRVRVAWIDLVDYTPAAVPLPPPPQPGQWVEITGVEIQLGYAPGVLELPEPGTSDPVLFPSIPIGWLAHDWAAMEVELIRDWENIMRWTLTVIDVDGDGAVLGGLRLYEAWPASINLFNPERPYGEGYLVDVFVVCDAVEEAFW